MSTKSPTIKRILKEAAELSSSPSTDYAAQPLESNLFEWHFTVRGPPAPSPFANGIYHGRIVLPPAYPLKPPSFRFLTPSGRFEVNREICLSISGFHEESWQPAWGIRTAIVAIRSFMDSDAGGQVGGMNASAEVRRRFADQSGAWRCAGCGGRSCEEILREREREVEEMGKGAEEVLEDVVPEELRLGYKDELGKEAASADGAGGSGNEGRVGDVGQDGPVDIPVRTHAPTVAAAAQAEDAMPRPEVLPRTTATQTQAQTPTPTIQMQQAQLAQGQAMESPAWIDKAIIGVGAALAYMVFRVFFL